jgi:beta-lactam-binding protein with PASTA domain
MTFFNYLFSKAFFRQLVLSVVLLIVLVFVVLWWLKVSTRHDQRIEVPDLSTMSLDVVEETLDELDLRYEIIDSANYNPDFPKYSVIEQIPRAGKFVKENRKIYLTLNRSSFPELVIPEVVGRTRRQAEPTLIAMGFQIGKISYRPYIAYDEVLELRHEGQKIEPGMRLQKTSVIDLVLGDGEGDLKQGEKKNELNLEGSSGDFNRNDDGGEDQS